MNRHDPYTAHLRFIAPAFGHAAIWRVVCVVLGFELVFFMIPDLIALLAPSPDALAQLQDGVTPMATILQFASFALLAAALWGLIWAFHARGLRSLLGPAGPFRGQLAAATLGVGLVLAVQEPLMLWGDWPFFAEIRPLGGWLLWLLPGLLAIFIQVSTEEIFFRGYLQQQLAVRFAHRWVWLGVPSVMFGLGHYANGFDAADGALWVIWATLLGMACADLTARTGNLGAAIGLHFANNAFALLIVGVKDWPMSGLALFLYPYEDPSGYELPVKALLEPWALMQLVLSALAVFVMWLAARVALRR